MISRVVGFQQAVPGRLWGDWEQLGDLGRVKYLLEGDCGLLSAPELS